MCKLSSGEKLKVFVSSCCGDNGKYDRTRMMLKKSIEQTNVATVYSFETQGASTISAGNHYTWALEDCDVCIFLIDNADGIPDGVQAEIETARRCEIKALYYFCDERSKEETTLQKSLKGATFAKSKTVHSFDELCEEGATDLLNDILLVYHHYCKGRISVANDDSYDDSHQFDLEKNKDYNQISIPKLVIKNIDLCKSFIIDYIFGMEAGTHAQTELCSSGVDELAEQMLQVLFCGKSIKNVNIDILLEPMKEVQEDSFFQIVCIRWKAIQSYFLGDVEKCIDYLKNALATAKNTEQPTWFLNDILIDLRNQEVTLNASMNIVSEAPAQRELNESEESVYYPVLDRIHDSLHEKYIAGLYKKSIESPFSVTLGNNFNEFGELLASSFIVAVYNGSLTHILLFHNKIRDFLFYLCNKYGNWTYRKELLKIALFNCEEKEAKGLTDSYPEILNKMDAECAREIMDYCSTNPVSHKRIISQLLAFGTVGYYLDESKYLEYEKRIVEIIKEWLEDDKSVVSIGQSIFRNLSGVAYRMSQDTLSEICCWFMDKHYYRWYSELFKFIANRINLNKMEESAAKKLIKHIVDVMEEDDGRKQIVYAPHFLTVLRNQNRELTNELDEMVKNYFPNYYYGDYNLVTTLDRCSDYPIHIKKYIDSIKKNNVEQGNNGVFFGHGKDEIATVRKLLLQDGVSWNEETLDQLTSVVSETLLKSKEGVAEKRAAISLLTCVAIKYPDVVERNKTVFEAIASDFEEIQAIDNTFFLSNVDSIALQITFGLLNVALGEDGFAYILEGLANIQNDTATTISVTRSIIEYLEIDDNLVLPEKIETIIMQNVMQWLEVGYLDIRWSATRILLLLLRNPENREIVNRKIKDLIQKECVYIKNLIIRQLPQLTGIFEDTYQYVLDTCKNDPCYVVRLVCENSLMSKDEYSLNAN